VRCGLNRKSLALQKLPDRVFFLCKRAKYVVVNIPWITLGDYNMVEKIEDQDGGRPHCIAGEKSVHGTICSEDLIGRTLSRKEAVNCTSLGIIEEWQTTPKAV
jgi:hypothetical protein